MNICVFFVFYLQSQLLLCTEDPECFHFVLDLKESYLPILDEVCVEAASRLFRYRNKSGWTMKNNIHLRIYGVPEKNLKGQSSFPSCGDRGNFICISGYVTKASLPFTVEFRREMCCERCGFVNMVDADYDQFFVVQGGKRKCLNPEEPCFSYKFKEQVENKKLNVNRRDCQDFRLRESYSGNTAIEDDLVEAAKTGDEVTVW